MSYVQKRTGLRKENLKSRLTFEMSRAYELDALITNIKKNIVDIREKNILMQMNNNKLKFEEPKLDMSRLNQKDTNGITSFMNDQRTSKDELLKIFGEKMNAVIGDYKNISKEINDNSEEFMDHAYYKESEKVLESRIQVKKNELGSRRENLEMSRQKWNEELNEKDKLLKILCEIDEGK